MFWLRPKCFSSHWFPVRRGTATLWRSENNFDWDSRPCTTIMEIFAVQMRRAFIFCNWISSHPFHWDMTLKVPRLHPSKQRIRLWKLNAWVTIAYTGFVIARGAQIFLEPAFSLFWKMYMACMITFLGLAAAFQLVTLLRKAEMAACLRRHFQCMEVITGESNPNQKKIIGPLVRI